MSGAEIVCAGNCPAASREHYPHPSVGCSFFPGHGPVVVVDEDGNHEIWKHGNTAQPVWWNDPPPR